MLQRYLLIFATTCCVALLVTACDRDSATPPVAELPADTPSAMSGLLRSSSPEGARVFFISPKDGATVQNPVKIEFGIEGMNLAKAGSNEPQSGHHHLIVDAGLPDESLPIPANENYIHFGDASSSTELTLAAGRHTLCLLLGDHRHIPHDPLVISEMITIVVE